MGNLCCICGAKICENEGHSPYPVKTDGECCITCADDIVLQAKINQIDYEVLKMPSLDNILLVVNTQIKRMPDSDSEKYIGLLEMASTIYPAMIRQYIIGQQDNMIGNRQKDKEDDGLYAIMDSFYDAYCDGYNGEAFNDTVILIGQNGAKTYWGTKYSQLIDILYERTSKKAGVKIG